jgi:nucleoside-diphosphate-sugar epimerase
MVAGSVGDMADSTPVVVVTGANGLVGTAVCRALVERSAQVRAVVRRAGSAPALDGVTEHVGDFAHESFARAVTQGADAVVTTVHPMGSSREVQHRVAVEGTPVLARAARDAGVARLVHVSTAGVYDRSAGVSDVAEDGALLPEGSGDYPDTKNATDAALAQVGGITTVLVRPPAIMGAGDTSVWNTLRPRAIRDGDRRANRRRRGPGCTSPTWRPSSRTSPRAPSRPPTIPGEAPWPVARHRSSSRASLRRRGTTSAR